MTSFHWSHVVKTWSNPTSHDVALFRAQIIPTLLCPVVVMIIWYDKIRIFVLNSRMSSVGWSVFVLRAAHAQLHINKRDGREACPFQNKRSTPGVITFTLHLFYKHFNMKLHILTNIIWNAYYKKYHQRHTDRKWFHRILLSPSIRQESLGMIIV